MKKGLSHHSINLGLLTIIVIGLIAFSTANAQLKDITFSMDWMINGTHSPYYLAVEKGFYRDAGFKVEIVRGYGGLDVVKKVAAKLAPFAITGYESIVISVIKEKTPVKAIAAMHGKSMMGVLYLKESGIKVPKDLEGKILGRSASGSSVLMFPAFLKANDIDRSKIKEMVIDATAFLPMLLSGKVDAVLEQRVHQGRFQRAADEGGQKVTVMPMSYSDFGLDTYGNVFLTHNDFIENDPVMVKKFIQTSIKGMTYAFEHPEEAASSLLKSNPQINKETAIGELMVMKNTWTAEMMKSGLGYMTPERTKLSVENITAALGLEKPEAIDVFYNNKFVK